ncbi:right-handed parallel beta-helix repeat-containing protein, partial [Flavisolibacter sp. BT320]|nr:right-handed parallel beta-helix repeat-containing protein [Flavisolibacter longurius]
IAITFFERDGGETMRVFWGNPAAGIPLRTPIPDAAFSGGGTTPPVPTPTPEPVPPTPDPTPTPAPAPSSNAAVESIPLGATVNMVVINKAPRAMGRFPNSGYLTVHSHSGHNQISSNDLSSNPNWTGGEVVIRKNRFVIDRQKITSHSGGTLNFIGTHIEPENNFGFFIQNHPQTLDQFGEWYYDPNTKKVRVYFGSENPNSYDVRATAADVLLESFSASYITFDNISFQGSNRLGLDIRYAQNVVLNNCEVLFSGEDAIATENMQNFKMENSKVENTNNIGYRTLGGNAIEIRRNTFNNTATMAGMGKSIGGYTGIELYGNNIVIANNTLTNTGYNAISFQGNNVVVENNFIDRFGFVKDDGGGIYSYRAQDGAYGRKVRGNIILRGIGAGEGTNSPSWKPMYGLFMDDRANNVEISDNTVSESGAGIFVHNAENIQLNNNTFYNNVKQVYVTTDQVLAGAATRNVTSTNNLFIAKYREQRTGEFATSFTDIGLFGHFDNNVYARPIDDNKSMFVAYDHNRFYQDIDLPTWKGMFGKDANSRRSPLQLPSGSNPDEYLKFEYNASSSARTISLGETYMDARGNTYSGEVTLQPYTSIVLIRTSGAARVASPENTVAANSLGSIAESTGMKVFPNPAKSYIEVSLQLPQVNNQRVNLSIQSASGATVKSMPVTVANGMITKIDVSTFSPGVYIINVIGNGQIVATKKFVKM